MLNHEDEHGCVTQTWLCDHLPASNKVYSEVELTSKCWVHNQGRRAKLCHTWKHQLSWFENFTFQKGHASDITHFSEHLLPETSLVLGWAKSRLKLLPPKVQDSCMWWTCSPSKGHQNEHHIDKLNEAIGKVSSAFSTEPTINGNSMPNMRLSSTSMQCGPLLYTTVFRTWFAD